MILQNSITNNSIKRNKMLFFFMLFLMSSVGMFGQTKEVATMEVVKSEIVFQKEVDIVSVSSQIDFVNWFMGSKQPQLKSELNELKNSNSKTITRKQILSSGITPNKVLYRTFMKKVSSQDNAIV